MLDLASTLYVRCEEVPGRAVDIRELTRAAHRRAQDHESIRDQHQVELSKSREKVEESVPQFLSLIHI